MLIEGIAAKNGAYDVSSLKRTVSGSTAVMFSGFRILRKALDGASASASTRRKE